MCTLSMYLLCIICFRLSVVEYDNAPGVAFVPSRIPLLGKTSKDSIGYLREMYLYRQQFNYSCATENKGEWSCCRVCQQPGSPVTDFSPKGYSPSKMTSIMSLKF